MPEGRMRCSAAARLCRQMLHFASPTEILRLRQSQSVFLSRRKKNSEKERPLRGFRREVRFIMSPPEKRRHNELNAAPPPETPQGTGKPGAVTDRDNVHSGESFCVRGKTCSFGEPCGTTLTLASHRGLRSRGAAMNRSPGETENRSSASGTATDTSRSETAPPAGGDEVQHTVRLYRTMLLFASLTGISRQRQCLPVFLPRFPVPTVAAVRAGRIGCHDFPRESGGNYGGRQREAGVI